MISLQNRTAPAAWRGRRTRRLRRPPRPPRPPRTLRRRSGRTRRTHTTAIVIINNVIFTAAMRRQALLAVLDLLLEALDLFVPQLLSFLAHICCEICSRFCNPTIVIVLHCFFQQPRSKCHCRPLRNVHATITRCVSDHARSTEVCILNVIRSCIHLLVRKCIEGLLHAGKHWDQRINRQAANLLSFLVRHLTPRRRFDLTPINQTKCCMMCLQLLSS